MSNFRVICFAIAFEQPPTMRKVIDAQKHISCNAKETRQRRYKSWLLIAAATVSLRLSAKKYTTYRRIAMRLTTPQLSHADVLVIIEQEIERELAAERKALAKADKLIHAELAAERKALANADKLIDAELAAERKAEL